MSRSNHKVKDVSKYQSLADLLYIQSNHYQSMSGQEYIADAVDEMIALKSDALALAMSDDYIEAMTDLHEYEQSLLQSDDECPDYADCDLVPFIVSPVIVPTCFLGSLRSTFSFLLTKFHLLLSSHLTKTVFKGGNDASIKEKVPIVIMIAPKSQAAQAAWRSGNQLGNGYPAGLESDTPREACLREFWEVLDEDEGGFCLAVKETDGVKFLVGVADANGPWAVTLSAI